MKKISGPIVFFGSGPVAAESLRLLHADFEIEAVITKPQPAHHKEAFPVLTLCKELGLTVFTPNGKQALSELFATRPVRSRLGVVIDYGFIINQDVIDYFELGIVNSHFSLLPQWRGADPITFSILSGQAQTGVSLMLIVEKMDEGPLLAQTPYDIPSAATTPELTEALIDVSNQTLQHILPLYVSGEIVPSPQETGSIADPLQPTYSRKLNKNDGILDFSKSAEQLEREIRAFSDWPKSRTTFGDIDVIVTASHVATNLPVTEPGKLIVDTTDKTLSVACGEAALSIDSLKPAGKNVMSAAEFIRGYGSRLNIDS